MRRFHSLGALCAIVVTALAFPSCSGSSSSPTPGGGTKPPPRRLTWEVQPISLIREGRLLPVVELAIRDGVTGEVDTQLDFDVELTLRGGDSAAVLSGGRTRSASGRARFDQLVIDAHGIDYELVARIPSTPEVEAAVSAPFAIRFDPHHIIVMLADGWGFQHIAATRAYTGKDAPYMDRSRFEPWAMSTYSQSTLNANQTGYDTSLAWTSLDYLRLAPTDSAASATALFTGTKTDDARVATTPDGNTRLLTLSELALQRGYGAGAVTSVPISHATVGAFAAHNSGRFHGFAIADELLWGNPNTTGNAAQNILWSGSRGPTFPVLDVLLGGGHPDWYAAANNLYVSPLMLARLRIETAQNLAWRFLERATGRTDAGTVLLEAAREQATERLTGIWGGVGGNLEFALADGSGHDSENPSLAQMAEAAFSVLERNTRRKQDRRNGFVLLVEGGAVDWAAHDNQMGRMIGEMRAFDAAVAKVVELIENPSNDVDWENTCLLVLGDHETGLLCSELGALPDRALGEVSDRTIALEKTVKGLGTRASWEDKDNDDYPDGGERVYWAWQTLGHSNQLVPLFVAGAWGALTGSPAMDPVRGRYVDNARVVYEYAKTWLRERR